MRHASPTPWRPRMWRLSAALLIGVHCAASWARTESPPPTAPCQGLSHAILLGHWRVDLENQAGSLALKLPPHRSVVIEATERGIDVTLEAVSDEGGALQADNPVRRSGVQRLRIQTGTSGMVRVTAQVKAHGGRARQIDLSAIDADAAGASPACRDVLDALVAADAAYAKGQLISGGKLDAPAGAAADAYGTALRHYEQAFAGVAVEARSLRAELAHAIAALLYQDLKQWRESEQGDGQKRRFHRDKIPESAVLLTGGGAKRVRASPAE